MEELKRNKPIKRFKTTIESSCKNASGSNLAEIQSFLCNPQKINRLHNNLKKEQQITTLLAPETPKNLNSFFYPLKVITSTFQQPKSLKDLIKINGTHGILINGKLGQGKSILLRYLQFLELNTGTSIPIFVELRKVKGAGSLITYCNQTLINLGFECSNKLFIFLLSEGYLSLFFDGYDEIPLDERDSFNVELSRICNGYPLTKVIVTSRENTEITTNKNFKNYTIASLDKQELPLLIKRILGTEEVYSPILKRIDKSSEFDFTVLDSPLLVTWFIIVYNKRLKIPKTKLGFYEDLFEAILSRHDGMKESHNRDSKSQLTDDEIKYIFCCICFLIRKDEITTFSKTGITKYIRKALNICNFEKIKPADYLYDLTHITCLLKMDGLEYEFIHESIVQYFSASFIANSTEDNVKEFYSNRVRDWKIRESELLFLEKIDAVRFYRYFYIPSFWDFMGYKSVLPDQLIVEKKHIEKIFPSPVCALKRDKENSFVGCFPLSSIDNYIVADLSVTSSTSRVGQSVDEFVNKKVLPAAIKDFQKFDEFISEHLLFKNESFSYLRLLDILHNQKLTHVFYEYLKEPVRSKLSEKLIYALNLIENEAKKKDLYD
jgi:hypothetical protein